MYNDWQRINAGSGASYSAANLTVMEAETNQLRDLYAGVPTDDEVNTFLASLEANPSTIIDKDSNTVYTIDFKESSELFSDDRAEGL